MSGLLQASPSLVTAAIFQPHRVTGGDLPCVGKVPRTAAGDFPCTGKVPLLLVMFRIYNC